MRKYFSAALIAAVLLCGCTDLREIEPAKVQLPDSTASAVTTTPAATTTTTSAATTTTTAVTTTSAATTTTAATTAPVIETEEPPAEPQCACNIVFGEHYLSDSEKAFLNDSMFIGDSICSGFEVYGLVEADKVIATKSVGARNLLDYKHVYKNKEQSLSYILKKAQPKLVFLSMGMNDVNMTSAEAYCENYSRIIDLVLETTDADVYFCAITPIDSDFSSNERIQSFNSAMRAYIKEHYPQRVHTVDFGRLFVCEDKVRLCDILSGGDGIHLAPYAYHMALWEIRNTLIADGLPRPEEQSPEEPSPEEQSPEEHSPDKPSAPEQTAEASETIETTE